MLCGRLNKKISILKKMKIPDKAGGHFVKWPKFIDVWAEVADVLDRRVSHERLADLQIVTDRFFFFTIRFLHELRNGSKLRIVYDGRVFEVLQTINEDCQKNETLKFFTREIPVKERKDDEKSY